MIKLVFAVGQKGEFGNDEGLPWNAPGDLQNFKEYTKGCTLVMSEATFRSLPFALPGRTSVVLGDSECCAKNGDEPDIILPTNMALEGLCDFLEEFGGEDVCIIGGRKLITEASTFATSASVTTINPKLVKEADVIFNYHPAITNLTSRMDTVSAEEYDYGLVLEWRI